MAGPCPARDPRATAEMERADRAAASDQKQPADLRRYVVPPAGTRRKGRRLSYAFVDIEATYDLMP